MKILGLVVEYNPFHNGHLHHIEASKKLVQPDVTIAIMSGHFMQRGVPAVTTKWNRAALALAYGVDLMIELPYAFSNQSADLFALGAVSLLKHLGATHLCFGSELGEIKELVRLADKMDNLEVKELLATGLSLPKAFAQVEPAFSGPNNTLGIQYIRAIRELEANIIPLTISREISGYNDKIPNDDQIASATAIRKLIDDGADYSQYVPAKSDDPYMATQNWEAHYKFLRHKLLTLRLDDLKQIHDMVEGIENRLVDSARSTATWNDFVKAVKTKRYTRTRIQRICANVLVGLTKQEITEWNLRQGAPYVRILGFAKTGASYLKQVKDHVLVPIYSNFSKECHPMLQHEIKVTAAWSSVYEPEYMSEIIQLETGAVPIIGG